MAIVTNNAHIASAIRLLHARPTMYLALGKTSPWTDELNPPQETVDTGSLTELIGIKKVTDVQLCRFVESTEKPTGTTITYQGKTWEFITEANAYKNKTFYLYITTTVDGTDLPLGSYRQVGIITDPVLKAGVTTPSVPASSVTSQGTLHFYENRVAQSRTAEVTVKESFMIEL